jgi:hypothetical protein
MVLGAGDITTFLSFYGRKKEHPRIITICKCTPAGPENNIPIWDMPSPTMFNNFGTDYFSRRISVLDVDVIAKDKPIKEKKIKDKKKSFEKRSKTQNINPRRK